MKTLEILPIIAAVILMGCKKDIENPSDCTPQSNYPHVAEECVSIFIDNMPGPNMTQVVEGDTLIIGFDFNPNYRDSILYVNKVGDQLEMYVMDLNTNQYAALHSSTNGINPKWMADGWIYMNKFETMERIHPQTGIVEILGPDSMSHMDRNHDGTQFVLRNSTEMVIRDLANNTTHYPHLSVTQLNWRHPDGKAVGTLLNKVLVYDDLFTEPTAYEVSDEYVASVCWCENYTKILFSTEEGLFLLDPATTEVHHLLETCNARQNFPFYSNADGTYVSHSENYWIDDTHYSRNQFLASFQCSTGIYDIIDTPLE
ncbi:MAG: hypothetical protein KDC12_06705 [Flavobacteriales bacterium]|nr:hypothetical protein [Flavobacteriales bacterium]